MKRVLRPPRYLPEVLQAISELRETGGSNTNKIVNHVRAGTNNKRSNIYARPRDLTTQIRRALNHGVSNGIVQHRAGKYRLNAKIVDPLRDCAECRRRARERRRKRGRHGHGRRRKHHRRHHSLASIPSDRFDSDSDSDFGELPCRHQSRRRPMHKSLKDVPIQEARRRGKKSGGRRRRGRRSRHGRQHKSVEILSPAKSKHEIEADLSHEPVYPDDHFGDGDDQMNDTGRVECDNPDCLCNVKEEENEENEEIQDSDELM